MPSYFNQKFIWAILMTGSALFFSILRDAYLSNRIDNLSLFVSYISLCALLTTPFGERMQYGLKTPIRPRHSFLLFFAALIFFWFLTLLTYFKFTYIAFIFGFVINVFCALSVASILGSIAITKGPSAIRMLGPVFPISNMILVLSGLNSYIYVVTISYLITFLTATIWLLIHSKLNKTLIYPKKLDKYKKIDLLSFFLHYLAFFISYLIVILNLKIDLMSDNIIKVRLPIYIYSLLTFSLPYINKKVLNFIILSSNLFLLLAIFLFFFKEKFICICIIECYVILFLSRIASNKSL